MELGILLTIVLVIAGFYIGRVSGRKSEQKKKPSQGVLNVDCGDPTGNPYLYLKLYVPVSEVTEHKSVIFDVNVIR